MKKSLLLIIADDLYFQSSFLKKFSELIGDTEYFIKDIVILNKLGLTTVIVHGGGPRIKKKLSELNIKSSFYLKEPTTTQQIPLRNQWKHIMKL